MALLGTPEYKVILLGEVGVGKTTFFLRIRDGEFVDTASIGRSNTLELCRHPQLFHSFKMGDSTEIKAVLSDTANAERFKTFTTSYYRDVDAAILMYSVEDPYTFDSLQLWIEEAREYCARSKNFVWAVVGNKSDLQFEIGEDRVSQICEQLNTKLCFYTSAKTGENVVSVFEEITKVVHKRCSEDRRSSTGGRGESIRLKASAGGSKKYLCC